MVRLITYVSERLGIVVTQLNQRESLRFAPVIVDLHGVADAIVGTDVWGGHAITIDYRAGILTFQREGIHPGLMIVYKYAEDPTINVSVDGRIVSAIVDTTSPDTLVLPRTTGASQRRMAHIQIADSPGRNQPGTGELHAAAFGPLVAGLLRSWPGARRHQGSPLRVVPPRGGLRP